MNRARAPFDARASPVDIPDGSVTIATTVKSTLLRLTPLLGAAILGASACSASSGGSGSAGGAGGGAASGGAGAVGGASASGGTFSFGGTQGSGATGGVPEGGECAAIGQQAENGFAPIDIIFAIDNSGSMTFEATEVQNNMNAFATAILNQGIDVHVAIISEDGPPGFFPPSNGVCIPPPLGSGGPCTMGGESDPPRYLRVPEQVSSSDALQKLLDLYPRYKPALRQKSLKYFAVVTDDNSFMDAFTFIQSVGALDPGWFDSWKFFGVFCDGSPCATFPDPCAQMGSVYADLVSQTGGTQGSLCQGQSNFSGVFSALAQTIVTQTELACEWEIPTPPAGQVFDAGQVNVRFTPGAGTPRDIYKVASAAECGAEGGWYYDDPLNPTKVQVCAVNCDQMKFDDMGTVEVLFGCATINVPK